MSGKSFREKDGQLVWLSVATEEHIRTKHRIFDPVAFIADTLADPVAVLQSKWEPDTRIYFKTAGHLYKAVIASWTQRRIKIAHFMRTVEGGETVWRVPHDHA